MAGGLGAERDHAERRKAERRLCLLGGADGVVHVLEQEGQADAGDDAQHQRERQVARNVGFAGRGGNTRRINDAKVIGAQSRGDARFFQFFQQPLVECPVAVQVALQDAVLDGALVELVGFLFLLLKGVAQHIFALQSGQVLSLEVVDGLVGFRLQLAVNLLQLVVELRDFRIRGTELGAEVGNLDSEAGLLFAQFVQKRIVVPPVVSETIAAETATGSLDWVWR